MTGELPRSVIPTLSLLAKIKNLQDRRRRKNKHLSRLSSSDLVVASHAKCGRTWLRTMISHIYHRQYGISESELINYDNFHEINELVPKIVFWGAVDDGSMMGSRMLAPPQIAVLLVRDPLDVVVSFYEHLAHRATANELARKGIPKGYDLRGVNLYDFACDRRLGLARIVRFMNAWDAALASHSSGFLLRYEDLQRDAAGELLRLAHSCRLAWSKADVEAAVAFGTFATMQRREAEGFFSSERMRLHPSAGTAGRKVREGRIGAHLQRFTTAQIKALRSYVVGRLSPRIGYHDQVGCEGLRERVSA
ncbi:MAG: sulfotransferase domain-containing protein [Geminicoccaceae bacterium]